MGQSAHGPSLHQLPLATQLSDRQKTEVFIPERSRANHSAACILVASTGDQKKSILRFILPPPSRPLFPPSIYCCRLLFCPSSLASACAVLPFRSHIFGAMPGPLVSRLDRIHLCDVSLLMVSHSSDA